MSETDAQEGVLTPVKQPWLKPAWKPGQSGNPAGRPKGARSKLGESFIQDLFDAWKVSGPSVIRKVIKDRPAEFLRIVASILPKDITLNVNQLNEIPDEDVMDALNTLRLLRSQNAKVIESNGPTATGQ